MPGAFGSRSRRCVRSSEEARALNLEADQPTQGSRNASFQCPVYFAWVSVPIYMSISFETNINALLAQQLP